MMETTKTFYDIDEFISHITLSFVSAKEHDGYSKLLRTPGFLCSLYSCFYNDGTRTSLVYAFCLKIDAYIYIGRNRADFEKLMRKINNDISLHDKRKVVIYDYNFSHDFHALMRGNLVVKDLFAKSLYSPLKVDFEGVEIRDFQALSGYRIVDDLFYTNMIVTPDSALEEGEIATLYNTVNCMQEYYLGQEEIYVNVGRLPLTNTGRGRKIQKGLLRNRDYKNLINSLTLEADELDLAKKAFSGGLCLCDENIKGEIISGVGSFDISSSYVASACAYMFPMSKGVAVTPSKEEDLKGAWVGYIWIKKLRAKKKFAFLEESNILSIKNPVYWCDKILDGENVLLAVSSVKWDLIKEFYILKGVKFGLCYQYDVDYLPRCYIEEVLKLYGEKTDLKGREDKKVLYTVKKAVLNSFSYGLFVQDPLRSFATYKNGTWEEKSFTVEEAAEKYNSNKSRASFYLWGIFVSDYSRAHLVRSIYAVLEDFLYSDTDSIKLRFAENHKQYFALYNKIISLKLEKMLAHYGLPKDLIYPKNKDGEIKPLGVWEYEGESDLFKAIGEKRYISKKGNKFKATIAGVNSDGAANYMSTLDDPFEEFDNYLTIPEKYTGRTNVYLIKTPRFGTVADRDGVVYTYDEPYGCFFSPCEYNITLTPLMGGIAKARL